MFLICICCGEGHGCWGNLECNSTVLNTIHIINEVIKCIKVDKLLGPSQVYPRTLCESREEINGPLAEIVIIDSHR